MKICIHITNMHLTHGFVLYYLSKIYFIIIYINYYINQYNRTQLATLLEHLRSPLVFGGVCVAYSLVFYDVSCVLLFVCLSFSFVAIAKPARVGALDSNLN